MMRRLFRHESGTSLVEFALVLPVFVLLLMGLVEVGRYTYIAILAAHAARAAVAYGSENLNTAQDAAGIKNAANLDAAGTTFTVTPSYYCTVSGGPITCPGNNGTVSPSLVYYVEVQVTGTFNPLFGYAGIPKNVAVTSTAVMRVQNQ